MVEQYTSEPHVSPFEAIRHQSDEYGEYWSGRELYKLLGYSRWERFKDTIERARIACEEAGQAASDHFHLEVHMVSLGSGGRRKVEDIHLSRYACYLTLQNADPAGKPIVALAQTYFAVQTRRQELADELALSALPEEQKRLVFRAEIAVFNKELAEAAQGAGVVKPEDFRIFTNMGYKGLYAGETENDIHVRKGLKPGEKILDWMSSEELGMNIFRVTQTEAKIRREQIQDKNEANKAHYLMGQHVREFVLQEGGTPPEKLPTPEKSIKQLRREEEQRQLETQRRSLQPSLFDEQPSDNPALDTTDERGNPAS